MALYFRIKDNGATVFRREEDERLRRLDLSPIAEANVRNGAIKPRKDTAISPAETAEIEAWLAARREVLAAREANAALAAIEAMNAAANWYSGQPDGKAAASAADDVLIAIHDLRSAIVRFKAKSLGE